MVVAALIATITFAAAFAIPGGYDGNKGRYQGMAVLARVAAFEAFVITNTIAMICSVISIFLCITGIWFSYRRGDNSYSHAIYRYNMAMTLVLVAMFAMMLAFIAATFAVLAQSIALTMSTCFIACIPFIAYILELLKLMKLQKAKKSPLRGLKVTQLKSTGNSISPCAVSPFLPRCGPMWFPLNPEALQLWPPKTKPSTAGTTIRNNANDFDDELQIGEKHLVPIVKKFKFGCEAYPGDVFAMF
ncbi:hypothetical protein RHSIM_Rhsim04G0191300 [Rhododendron simsii]|uniref:PGG domain-containing protein n=1 Tax=Rhododendron simsii TaxID=118357 RepID=A0A834H331_RHOSS|nr:hypothetical protein RHSIM_Rhsim04G0191300 [Rhododendron simsii]